MQGWFARTAYVCISVMAVGAENSTIYIYIYNDVKEIDLVTPQQEAFSGMSDSREIKRETGTD